MLLSQFYRLAALDFMFDIHYYKGLLIVVLGQHQLPAMLPSPKMSMIVKEQGFIVPRHPRRLSSKLFVRNNRSFTCERTPGSGNKNEHQIERSERKWNNIKCLQKKKCEHS